MEVVTIPITVLRISTCFLCVGECWNGCSENEFGTTDEVEPNHVQKKLIPSQVSSSYPK